MMSRDTATVLGYMVNRELDRLEWYQGTDEDLLSDWRQKYDDVSDLHFAAFYGDLASVRRLTRLEPNVDTCTTHGPKLLTPQLQKGTRESFGRDLVGFFIGSTPLMLACGQGHLDVIKYLIESCGADTNAVDSLGLTPLAFAAANGHIQVVRYLLSKHTQGINKPEVKLGMTPVNLASLNNHTEVVKVMLKRHDGPLIPDRQGRLPIHYAAWNYNSELVEYLCIHDDEGMGINVRDFHGNAPLHMLVSNHLESGEVLFRPVGLMLRAPGRHRTFGSNVDPPFTTYGDCDTETPTRYSETSTTNTSFGPHLRHPINSSCFEISEDGRELTNTTDLQKDCLDDNAYKDSPIVYHGKLDYAVGHGDSREEEFKHSSCEANRHPSEHRGVPNTKDGCITEDLKQPKSLDNTLPDVTDTFKRGTGDPDERYACLKKIIESGANVNMQNSAGETVLHKLCASVSPVLVAGRHLILDDYTVSLNQLVMLNLLLQYGGDPNIVDNTGRTAAILCEKRGNWLAMEMLEKSRGLPVAIATSHVDMKAVVQRYGWGRLVDSKRFRKDIEAMSTSIIHGDVNNKAYKLARRLLQEAMSVL